jgi:hypothetical protein
LLIYLPPYSSPGSAHGVLRLPAFCQGYPTAVINYRWAGYAPFDEHKPVLNSTEDVDGAEAEPPLIWPAPVHDTLLGYSWIVENLTPPTYTRRDVYVFGSYMGASLATSLALTENHPHQRMAVRGVVAYNGIYDWTMFLPDHRINRKPGRRSTNVLEDILGQPGDPAFEVLKEHASPLFGKPSHLFDPFASPCLFFHTPGLYLPQDFTTPGDPALSMMESMPPGTEEAIRQLAAAMVAKPPRQSPLGFPPSKSTLKLPETLLLHTSPPATPWTKPKTRRKPVVSNHFELQAERLASLMRRSLDKLEFKERARWDEDFDRLEAGRRRVQVGDVGLEEDLLELPDHGEMLAREWLEDRMWKKS